MARMGRVDGRTNGDAFGGFRDARIDDGGCGCEEVYSAAADLDTEGFEYAGGYFSVSFVDRFSIVGIIGIVGGEL